MVDPLADSYHSFSPYNYALNDPIGKLDPNGMWVETANGWSTSDRDEIAEALRLLQNGGGGGDEQDDPPKKKGLLIANTPGSIIRKDGKSQVQRGDGSTEAFLDNAYELGFGLTPVGTIFDIRSAITGEDMSGEKLPWGWRLGGLVPGISEIRKTTKVGKSFFEGTKYTDKVLGQMKKGDFHGFPESVKAFESSGVITTIKGGDGVTRQMLKIPGEYGNKKGVFEFIKEADGTINHRLFRPNP